MKAIDSSIEKLNCSIRALVVARVVLFFFEYDKRSVVVPFVLANPSRDTRGQSAEKVTKNKKSKKRTFQQKHTSSQFTLISMLCIKVFQNSEMLQRCCSVNNERTKIEAFNEKAK